MKLTQMVCANLERLIASHDETNLLVFFMLEDTHFPGAALLPFGGSSIKPEQFGSPDRGA
jgi:hypothetical protein